MTHRVVLALGFALLLLAIAVSCSNTQPPPDIEATVAARAQAAAKAMVEATVRAMAVATPTASPVTEPSPTPSPPVTLTIQSSGGVVAVDRSGSPIDGLRLEVPAGAYEDARPFVVSQRPLRTDELGEHIRPVSPVISVDNGGVYSDEIMTLRIPVEVTAGHFAMAFFYEEETGTLEAIPVVDAKGGQVTLAMKHFSDIVVVEVDPDDLPFEIDSGFRPRVDDWHFENNGSYVSPGGQCTGQTLTAMWYFARKVRDGSPNLYGLHDGDTPDLWQDDVLGYRLASVVQEDINWDVLAKSYWERLGDWINPRDGDEINTWNQIRAAMYVTGQPQLIGVWRTDNQGRRHGHALIGYKISGGKLLIADPNFPGDRERYISINRPWGRPELQLFSPYRSGDNAEAIKRGSWTEYDEVDFYGKAALVNWDMVGGRWRELEQGSIGSERFPSYQLAYFEDGERRELRDGAVLEEQTLTVEVLGEAGGEPDFVYNVNVYHDGRWHEQAQFGLELQTGINRLGIAVYGQLEVAVEGTSSVRFEDRWIGFDWITVEYAPTPTPEPMATPRPTPTPAPTATAVPTPTPAPTPTATAVPTPTSTPTPTPTPTAVPLPLAGEASGTALGGVHYTAAPKTWTVQIPTGFTKLEIANYDVNKPSEIKRYMGWNGYIKVNGQYAWKFLSATGGVARIMDHTIGEEVDDTTGRGLWLDITSMVQAGSNTLTYYHYTAGDGIGVKVRVSGAATPTPTATPVSPTPTPIPTPAVDDPATLRIAFVSTREAGSPEIYTTNPDGSRQTAITAIPSKLVYDQTWSPDGSMLAFKAGVRDGGWRIYEINPDGSGLTALTSALDDVGAPTWSPDGSKIAFRATSDYRYGNSEVYVVNTDSSVQTNLTNHPAADGDPVWSSDGSKIAFNSDRDDNWDIYVMNADGSGQINLTNDTADDYDPAWSPDGTKIAFISYRDGNDEIYVMNADGSGQANLTNNTADDRDLVWSPDGMKIAFISNRDGNREIYIMNADGSRQSNLTNNAADDYDPAWSPDGMKIAFTSSRDGNGEIYVMNADGSGQTNLTNNTSVDYDPAWSP